MRPTESGNLLWSESGYTIPGFALVARLIQFPIPRILDRDLVNSLNGSGNNSEDLILAEMTDPGKFRLDLRCKMICIRKVQPVHLVSFGVLP